MPRALILGTGTGIGKTSLAVALVRALRSLHPHAHVLGVKPVETGVVDSIESDAARLSGVSTITPPSPPFALSHGVSPHQASREARTPIALPAIREWLAALPYTTLPDTWVVIETAGGVFTPLAPDATNADLAAALDPTPWILVVPDRLGALHETRSILLASESIGLRPPHIALRRPDRPDASTGTNARELRALGWADALDASDDDTLAAALLGRLNARAQHA